MNPAITNIDNLKNWFFQSDLVYWSLWAGMNKKIQNNVIARQKAPITINESWEMLERNINSSSRPGARFTIYVSEAASGERGSNVGMTVHYEVTASNQSAINGIGPAGIYGNDVQSYIAQQVSEQVERRELLREIDELKYALHEKQNPTWKDKFFDMAISDPDGAARIAGTVMHAVTPLFGALQALLTNPKGVPISIMGFPPNQPQSQPPTEPNQPGETLPDYDYDNQRVGNALERIRVHFPQPESVLEAIATFIETQPAMAQSLFNQHAQQGHNG
ncbi:MAG: hypothetical protein AAFO94_06330 [Bacteroidota bacterium]